MNYEEFLNNKISNWNFDNSDNKTIDDYNSVIENIKYSIVDISNYFSEFTSYDLTKFSTSLSFNDYCNYILYFRYIEDLRKVHNESRSYNIFSDLNFDKISDEVNKTIDKVLNSDDDFEELLEKYNNDDIQELLKDDESLDLNISKSELTQNLRDLGICYHINDLTEFYNKLQSCSLKIISVDDMVNVFRYYLSSIYEDKVDAGLFSIEVLAELVRKTDHTGFVAMSISQISQLIESNKSTEYQVQKALKALEYFKIVTKHDVTRKIKINSFHLQIFAFVG